MNYIVLDLEWNPIYKKNLKYVLGEIIEIGAYKLDNNFNIVDSFHDIITPKITKRLDSHIIDIIKINPFKESDTHFFLDVGKAFMKWCGSDFIFCSWGNADLDILFANLAHYNVGNYYKNPTFYIDIQRIYGYERFQEECNVKLENAVMDLNIRQGLRTYHSALDDAYFTSRILQRLDMNRWKEYYSLCTYFYPKKNCVYKIKRLDCDELIYFNIKKKYGCKDVLKDELITMINCPKCNSEMLTVLDWYAYKNLHYRSIKRCPYHENFFAIGDIRVKTHLLTKKPYIARIIYYNNPLLYEQTIKRKDEIVDKRRRHRINKRLEKN